jgi:hypothetical protein
LISHARCTTQGQIDTNSPGFVLRFIRNANLSHHLGMLRLQ